jgi:hypothetical protein
MSALTAIILLFAGLMAVFGFGAYQMSKAHKELKDQGEPEK